MLLEVASPPGLHRAQLQQAFEVAEFDAESCERREGVDDEPTAVAGDVIALVGIRFRLDRAVDADGWVTRSSSPQVCASPTSAPGGRRRTHTL